jgi:hypothetical protein
MLLSARTTTHRKGFEHGSKALPRAFREGHMMTLPDRLRLPFSFDARALSTDVAGFAESDWEGHFNQQYYQGDWSGIALRSTGGRLSLFSDPNGTFSDTAALGACPAVRAALSELKCDFCAVRFLRLGSGARVREHRDYGMGMECGEIRLHVPIQNGPGSEFVLAGTPLEMAPGECWYVDVSLPHAVANKDVERRVHLVIDCVVNDWLRDVLFGAARMPFERFRALVAIDDSLRDRLWEVEDSETFVALSVALGAERGMAFAPDAVRTAMAEGRRRWLDAVNP